MKLHTDTFFFDTELAKNLYAGFHSKRPEFRSHKDIIKNWWLICWAGQWADSNKVIGASVLSNKKRFAEDPTDDYHAVKTLYDQIKKAQVIIGHNMKKFDWKKFMARVTYHGLPPISMPLIIDTMLMAKAIAEYDSNSLSFLCSYHGLPNKATNRGNDLWNDIAIYALQKDYKKLRKCITEMVVYCGPDVIAVKALYEYLLPYAPPRFRLNQNLSHADGVDGCPCCKSDNLQSRGYALTTVGKYQKFQCQDCGSWSQGKKNLKKVSIK